MIFDIGPQQAPHKKGLSERLTFYKERPDWSTLMPSLTCRFLSSMYRLSRLSTLLGIVKSDQISLDQVMRWMSEYTSWQYPPRCHRCSAWCSPCTGCQTSLMRKKVVAYFLIKLNFSYSTLEYQLKYYSQLITNYKNNGRLGVAKPMKAGS